MISSEGKDSDKDMVTPPRKKLKQARLSFQKLSPGLESTSPKNIKKRKISEDSGDDIKIVKVIKPDKEKCQVSEDKTHVSDVVNESDQKLSSEHESKEGMSQNVNTDIEHLEKDIKEDNLIVEPEEISALNENETQEKSIISKNEKEVIETDSSSSDSDSEELSDSENGLNENNDILNSSGSHEDLTSKEDAETNSKSGIDITSKTDVMSTPKSKTVKSDTAVGKKLTPKQQLKRQEAAKRKEEKEEKRKEKERKRAEEKEVKLKEMQEKKEKRQKEREEKEEQKRKEKEEKEKKKQAELELKTEEKRLKEEERRKKEEQRVLEKRKKDEKKLAEEEAKKKEAAAFANFFLATKGLKPIEDEKIKAVEHFMPFQVKADMRLAPILRTNVTEIRLKTFDDMLKEQAAPDLYLKELKKKEYIPASSGKTWPLSEVIAQDEDDEVIHVTGDNEVVESHPTIAHPKAKLLLFCENRRPPYWGTWSKKSKFIKPTRPFNKDKGYFDYEIDSDDEWEEEEPGESLHGSDDEKESEDEYEVDNEFIVPHGYLSDEENFEEEEETISPESMKAKLKMLEVEFEEEMKHKTERIKPRLLGCFWVNENTNPVGARVLGLLSSYKAVFKESPIAMNRQSAPDADSPENENQGSCTPSSKKKKFPEQFVPALIKLVHGNINGRGFLVKEFSAYVKSQLHSSREISHESENERDGTPHSRNTGMISKIKMAEKIKEIASWIACPEKGPFLNRFCWYVSPEIRSAYGVDDLVIPNKTWKYSIAPKRELELSNTIPSPSVNNDTNPRHKSLPLITKFTKKMSQEELQSQLVPSPCDVSDAEILEEVKINSTSMESNKSITEESSSALKSSVSNCNNVNSQPSSKTLTLKSVFLGHLNKSSENRKKKLQQFKSKASGIIPHLEQRKRVQILKSVPLGQKILSASSTNSGSHIHINESDNKDNKSSADKNASNADDEVIVID